METPQSGRPDAPDMPVGSDALAAAREYGIDLTLLLANLRRTPEQRLRQLDAMLDFKNRVRRIDP